MSFSTIAYAIMLSLGVVVGNIVCNGVVDGVAGVLVDRFGAGV